MYVNQAQSSVGIIHSLKEDAFAVVNLFSASFRTKYLSFFIPSFLAANSGKVSKGNAQHGGISSLDGLRGLACLCVVNEHIVYNFSKTFLMAYGRDDNHWFVQWPFIRIFWCGLSMVNIFFVISGYVLTYKPFSQIHKGDPSAARATIASSTFRRIPRLYLPMWVSVWLCGFMTWLGFYDGSIEVWQTKDNIYHLHEGPPIHFKTFWLQLQDVAKHSWRPLNVFGMTDHLIHAEHYDLHTWTIPVEFRCSMVLFGIISAISQFKMRYRIPIMIFLTTMVMTMKQKNTMMFLTGAILADIDHRIRNILHYLEHEPKHSMVSTTERFVAKWLHPNSNVYPVLFTVGIYLLCVPTYYYQIDPFYAALIRHVPLQEYNEADVWLRFYGATMVVWAVANSTKLKPIFVHPVVSYLGKISFALYLCHGNVIRCLMYPAVPSIYSTTGDGTWENQTAVQMFFSTVIGYILVLPLSLYLADLFMKGVDVPLTKFGREMELAMIENHDERKYEGRVT